MQLHEAPAVNLFSEAPFSGLAPEVADPFCRPRLRSVLPTATAIRSADRDASVTPAHHNDGEERRWVE
jgi:hypothetical protein